jgi:tRNA nucleotidyltransferase (CCA-adding enzyme)
MSAVTSLADSVRSAGGRAYLVGGAVRDAITGAQSVKDADIEVFGVGPEALERIVGEKFSYDMCGLSFGVLKIKGLELDVSLPRRESKRGLGHRGFLIDSDPSLSVREASSRRDFTINAIYFDPLDGTVEDPWGGIDDIKNRVLRHVSPKFAEDPLRVLRGMQFAARFGLSAAPETVAICRSMDMEGLPKERLFEEWSKLILKGREIGNGLGFLRETLWHRHFPELAALSGCRQDPEWHPEGDVWNHTCLCLDAFAAERTGDRNEDLVVGLAVLCHDFGKPATTLRDRRTGHVRSLGHDEAGAAPTLSFLKRLTDEERILREVPPLVKCHMQPFALWKSGAGDSAVRRLAARVVRIDRLIRVVRADHMGRGSEPSQEDRSCLEWLAKRADALRVADAAPKPILLGRHLIALGHRPSARFHEWLSAAYEAQLDGRFSDVDGAIAYFLENIFH